EQRRAAGLHRRSVVRDKQWGPHPDGTLVLTAIISSRPHPPPPPRGDRAIADPLFAELIVVARVGMRILDARARWLLVILRVHRRLFSALRCHKRNSMDAVEYFR